MIQEVKQLKAQVTNMCRMEYQVVTTFTPGGRLYRTKQFVHQQGRHKASLSPPGLPYRRLVTLLAGPPLTTVSRLDYGANSTPSTYIGAAAVSSPTVLGAPAMAVA